MYCPNCGKELELGTSFCPNCGTKLEETAEKKSFTMSKFEPYTEIAPKYYTTSLIIGILSIFLSGLNYLGIPFVHLAGIALGIIGISLVKNDKMEAKKFSMPALITSIIGLTLGIAAIIIGIVFTLMEL